MALLSSLNTALTGLRAAMSALQTTGHNITNAATPGYSRQRVELTTQRPLDTTRFQIGRGVEVRRIVRIIDESLELSLRSAASGLSNLGVRAETLQRVEGLLGALSGSDIGAQIDRLFDAIQDFVARPQDGSTRAQVLAAADSLARTLNSSVQDLRQVRTQLNGDVRTTVAEINRLADEIAGLNRQIVSAENGGASGRTANDLRDQRDLLLRQLSDLIAISAVETSTGEVNVLAGSSFLVFGGRANDLTTTESVDRGVVVSTPSFADSSQPLAISDGRLRGLLDARDQILANAVRDLDRLAHALAYEFNRVQSTGQGLERFSTLTSLSSMPDPSRVVAVDGVVTAASSDLRTLRDASLATLPATPPFNPVGRLVRIFSGANVLETRRITGFDAATGTLILDQPLAQPMAVGDRYQITDLPFPVINGSFEVVVTNELSGLQQSTRIDVDLDRIGADSTWSGIVGVINGIAGLTATLTPDNRIRITADSTDLRFHFAGDTSGFLAAAGLNSFFLGSTASDIAVNPALAGNPRLLSGARSNAPGDNTNALAFAALRDLAVIDGSATFEEFYQTFAGGIGVQAADARGRFETQAALAQQLENQRERVSGVNLDEEAVHMIQFQRLFQASARYVNVIDELLDTLINGL